MPTISTCYRSKHEIAAEIITSLAYGPQTRKGLREMTNLVYSELAHYLAWLSEYGLVKPKGNKLSLTKEGNTWLEQYNTARF